MPAEWRRRSSIGSKLGGIKQDLINSFDCSLDRVVAVPVRTSRLTPNHVIPRPAGMEHNKVNVTVDPNVSHKSSDEQLLAMRGLDRGERIELDQGTPARCGSLANFGMAMTPYVVWRRREHETSEAYQLFVPARRGKCSAKSAAT